jgi:4-amino-4-deoxy-L-arabinose transferase-like glycosyltransferase
MNPISDSTPTDAAAGAADSRSRLWHEPELWLLVLLVVGAYFTRLDTLSIRGEEPRRARVAYEMLHTGDWIVPRQQGVIYLSRPPLGNWLIATVGYLRGGIDSVAVRLPSALATLCTALLIYAYCRAWLTRLGAFAAGLSFATTAMVLEMGRLGESEAVFTCLVSSSLLVWHFGYQRGWPPAMVWCLGYGLAALAGLSKGPQGPVYFVAPAVGYLLLRRDWRYLASGWHLCGILTFLAVVGAWQVPFALATDLQCSLSIWVANAAERFADDRFSTIAWHLISYPLELFCCLAPWSLPLLYLTNRRFWTRLADIRPWVEFSLLAIAVCLPSVWFAAGAKGRYFMPLFPCFAVLAGAVIERCWQMEPTANPRRAWNRFLLAAASAAACMGLLVVLASLVKIRVLSPLAQPLPFAFVYGLVAIAAACCLVACRRATAARLGLVGLAALGLVLVCTSAGVAVNLRRALNADTAGDIDRLKQQLPAEVRLVSFGQISHAFAYHYGGMIPTVPWPESAAALGSDVEYFCFGQLNGEPGDLPFAWQRVAQISLDRTPRPVPERTVMVGRRLPGAELASLEADEKSAENEPE